MGLDQNIYYCDFEENHNDDSDYISSRSPFHHNILYLRKCYGFHELFVEYAQFCEKCRCGREPLMSVYSFSKDGIEKLEKKLIQIRQSLDFNEIEEKFETPQGSFLNYLKIHHPEKYESFQPVSSEDYDIEKDSLEDVMDCISNAKNLIKNGKSVFYATS